MTRTVTFPGLGLELHMDRVAVELFGLPIYWYGVIIAVGFLLAVAVCYRLAPRFGLEPDDVIDLLFFAVPLSIIGARLYYVVFNLDIYRTADGSLSLAEMVDIRDGGLAIYGGVLAAAATLLVFCWVKKLDFFAFADLGVYGLLIGQCVGRWGNFVNVEAYGGPCDLFDGQMMWSYVLWYGFGRGLIEGLRTDSLYLFGTGIRVSQALGFASAALGAALLIYHLCVRRHAPEELYVNRMRAKSAEKKKHEEDMGYGGDSH